METAHPTAGTQEPDTEQNSVWSGVLGLRSPLQRSQERLQGWHMPTVPALSRPLQLPDLPGLSSKTVSQNGKHVLRNAFASTVVAEQKTSREEGEECGGGVSLGRSAATPVNGRVEEEENMLHQLGTGSRVLMSALALRMCGSQTRFRPQPLRLMLNGGVE